MLLCYREPEVCQIPSVPGGLVVECSCVKQYRPAWMQDGVIWTVDRRTCGQVAILGLATA